MKALKREVKAADQKGKPRREMQVRVAPTEASLNRLSRCLQETLAEGGISLQHALKNLELVRQQRFQRLYGKK